MYNRFFIYFQRCCMNQNISKAPIQKAKATSPAFGVLLLLKALQASLTQPDAIKGKILGNALYISASTRFPAQLELMGEDFYRQITDEQKKQVALELEKMKKPYYDTREELQKLILKNWVEKTFFAKKENRPAPNSFQVNKRPGGATRVKTASTQPARKAIAKTVPVVIVKKKMI